MIGAIESSVLPGMNYPGVYSLPGSNPVEQVPENRTQAEKGPDQVTTDTTRDNPKTQNTSTSSSNTSSGAETEAKSSERVPSSGTKDKNQLSESEQKEVQQLKQTDQKVRAHEQAHLAAAGGISVSGASFQFKRGPDGKNYAVSGEVQIDTSKEDDPRATITKAQKIISAALAPADPSGQDRKVASKARQMQAQAQMEIAKQQFEKNNSDSTNTDNTTQNSSQNTSTKNTSNQNTSTQNTSSKTESNITSDSSAIPQQTHPGIKTYQQNQSYSPKTDSNTQESSSSIKNITSSTNYAISSPLSQYHLDIAA